jgi:ribosomal protein S24E
MKGNQKSQGTLKYYKQENSLKEGSREYLSERVTYELIVNKYVGIGALRDAVEEVGQDNCKQTYHDLPSTDGSD